MLEMIERTDVNITKWEKKRRKTLIVYLLQNILNGIGLSFVDITAWYYVTDLMDVKTPKLFYGLITAMVYISPMILVTPVSKWLIKTKEIRKLLVTFNLLNLAGSVLYVIPFSPFYAVAARLLYGCNLVLRFVMTSELFHSYSDEELLQKITLMSLGVFFGGGIGAVLSFAFLRVDFTVLTIHITYGNVCSIPVFIMTSVQLFLIIGVSYNVSNEYDLKAGEIGLNNSMLDKYRGADSDRTNNDRKLTPKFDVTFLLCMSFYCGIWIQLPIRLLPLVVEQIEYPKEVVSILFLGYSVLNVIILFVIVQFFSEFSKFSSKAIYYCEILTLLLLTLLSVCLRHTTRDKHIVVNSCLLGLIVIAECAFNLVDRVYIIVGTAKLIYNTHKTAIDGWKLLLYFIGRVVGSLASAYIYEYFRLLFLGHVTICFLLFFIMLVRRSTLGGPRPLI